MESVRKFVTFLVALALANYGVLATASAHTHDAEGFHQVHVAVDDDHGDGHRHHSDDVDHDEGTPGSEHHESSFHSHSSPQFGPADSQAGLAIRFVKGRTIWPDATQGPSPSKDGRLFKPPRMLL